MGCAKNVLNHMHQSKRKGKRKLMMIQKKLHELKNELAKLSEEMKKTNNAERYENLLKVADHVSKEIVEEEDRLIRVYNEAKSKGILL